MCFRSLREVMKFEDELPMLVAPASRLFSTSSFTAVPRFSTTCPEQMRWTEPRSMGRMAPAGCGLGREGQQITAVRASSKPHTGLPKRAGRGGGNRGQTGIALAAAVRPRARSATPVRGAKRPERGLRRRGPGPAPGRCTHTLTRAQPPPSGPRRGGTCRGLLRLPPRSVSAGSSGTRPSHTALALRPVGTRSAAQRWPMAGGRAGGRIRSPLGATRVSNAPLRQWTGERAGRRRRSGRVVGREPPCP